VSYSKISTLKKSSQEKKRSDFLESFTFGTSRFQKRGKRNLGGDRGKNTLFAMLHGRKDLYLWEEKQLRLILRYLKASTTAEKRPSDQWRERRPIEREGSLDKFRGERRDNKGRPIFLKKRTSKLILGGGELILLDSKKNLNTGEERRKAMLTLHRKGRT